MEAVIFIGLQAAGKSTFYLRRFFRTHVRINRDMLKTEHRERLLLDACLAGRQPFVIDKVSAAAADRATYIRAAKAAGFQMVGYYFQSKLDDCLARNAARPEGERVPDMAIVGTYNRLQLPSVDEGFDRLYYVRTTAEGEFVVEEWRDET
jgi:predicted kinase